MKTLTMVMTGSVLFISSHMVAYADADDMQQMQTLSSKLGFISPEQANEKALAAKPGVVTEMELDDRDFRSGWDYEFEIVDAEGIEWDVLVDAKTGEVGKVSREYF